MSDKYAALREVAENAIAQEGDIWWDQEQLTRYPDTMEIPATEANFIEAASPATILELLAERDADKRRIDVLRQDKDKLIDTSKERISNLLSRAEAAENRLTELEARTLTVKLPGAHHVTTVIDKNIQQAFINGEALGRKEVINAFKVSLAAAGISLKIEGE